MYRIVLKNVGCLMFNLDRVVAASDINRATSQAYAMVRRVLGYGISFHFSVVGDEISVVSNNATIGSLSITKLR